MKLWIQMHRILFLTRIGSTEPTLVSAIKCWLTKLWFMMLGLLESRDLGYPTPNLYRIHKEIQKYCNVWLQHSSCSLPGSTHASTGSSSSALIIKPTRLYCYGGFIHHRQNSILKSCWRYRWSLFTWVCEKSCWLSSLKIKQLFGH